MDGRECDPEKYNVQRNHGCPRSSAIAVFDIPATQGGSKLYAMPTQSIITAAEKERVKSAIPGSTSKILVATHVRIYYAYPSPDRWSYSGLQGVLALVSDKLKGGFWFRLVDLVVSGLFNLFQKHFA